MVHLTDNPVMWAFTLVVILDLIMDLIRPLYVKDAYLSGWGTKSIIRNAITYAVVVIGYPYLCLIGAEDAATAFLMAFIYQYLVWIVTTWCEIGWWLPEPIIKFVKANADKKELDNILNKEESEDKDNGTKNG